MTGRRGLCGGSCGGRSVVGRRPRGLEAAPGCLGWSKHAFGGVSGSGAEGFGVDARLLAIFSSVFLVLLRNYPAAFLGGTPGHSCHPQHLVSVCRPQAGSWHTGGPVSTGSMSQLCKESAWRGFGTAVYGVQDIEKAPACCRVMALAVALEAIPEMAV